MISIIEISVGYINIISNFMIKKLRILFVSRELIAADIAYQLKKEGHDVKLFIESRNYKNCFDGMVNKTSNWKN